jgi:hypothetical protein
MSSKPLSTLTVALAGLFGFLAPATAQLPNPGNLTITVQENENGSVTFSASGTAYTYFSAPLFNTPTDGNPANPSPPHTLTSPPVSNPPLPPGLILSFSDDRDSEPETSGAPEQAVPDPKIIQYPLVSVIYFENGNWSMTGSVSEVSEEENPVEEGPGIFYFLSEGTILTGSGSVTVTGIPFTNFVPGTYTIPASETDPRGRLSGNNFQITYKVIPFSQQGSPRLTLESASQFPDTRIQRLSPVQTLKLKNVGDAEASGIRAELGGDRGDFRVRIPRRPLAPGASLLVQTRFRPTTQGTRRSPLSIRSNAPTVSTLLTGEGIREILAPRFPRGAF